MAGGKLIVTGATGGLGPAVVSRLLVEYVCVILHRGGRGFAELNERVGPSDRLTGVAADLSSEASIREAVSKIEGPVYGLVHLAGGFAPGSVEETSFETWSKMLALNTTAAFLTIRETLPRMSRPGRIVAISAEASIAPSPGITAYSVSKVALNALIQLLALELRGSGITVNAIAPAAMATAAMTSQGETSKLVPLEQVAETIAFLLSDAAAGISGAVIPVRR
ncbi:MAG TPA: SDR family NAD(P)-dependent oxidoreductase [Thermoanaerobaculia bacterium]|nr:SDR family NAD(P)-dependent oxidoreductase [Thermoanaerobaculia bacterium]